MTTVLWFKRDLRVSDHPALARAAQGDAAVLPLVIVEPEYWRLPDMASRHWAFAAEAIGALRRDLARLGAPLAVRVGDAVDVLDDLRRAHGVTRLVSHEETGNLWTFARDRRVAAWARERGVGWEEIAQSGVVRRLPHRDGWARARDRFMFAPAVPEPLALRAASVADPGRIPSARDLGLVPDGIETRQRGGRPEAEALLRSFLETRGNDYRRAMASPVTAEEACSRLSPHFAWGTISVREAVQATAARQREVRGRRDGWAGSLKSFQSRLAWRDHFMQKLEDEPAIETRALHPAYEDLRGAPDAARLAAWERGETGIPFVDACMRMLRATGWINFRMRAMLVAVASYHLSLDWRATGPHLARLFTDYEPGIHWPQMQMQSGTTGMNTVRIYNPVKQGTDQDPDGVFTRAWLPELREVPDRVLQEPWRWEGAGRLAYPSPIVDVAAAARLARERVWAARRGEAFREEARRIVKKHASRKDRTRRFVRDPEPREASEDRQLRLDL